MFIWLQHAPSFFSDGVFRNAVGDITRYDAGLRDSIEGWAFPLSLYHTTQERRRTVRFLERGQTLPSDYNHKSLRNLLSAIAIPL